MGQHSSIAKNPAAYCGYHDPGGRTGVPSARSQVSWLRRIHESLGSHRSIAAQLVPGQTANDDQTSQESQLNEGAPGTPTVAEMFRYLVHG